MTTDPHAALVEKMARAQFDARYWSGREDVTWESISERNREMLRGLARALLPIVLREKAGAWDEGQKSGLRYADRAIAAQRIGRPDLPGPPTLNPYREKEATDGR